METRTVRKRKRLPAKKNTSDEENLKKDKKKPLKSQIKTPQKTKSPQLNAEFSEDKSKISKSEKKPKKRKKTQKKKKQKEQNDDEIPVSDSKEAIGQVDSEFWREKLMLLNKMDRAELELSKKQKRIQLFLVCLTTLFLIIGTIVGFTLQKKHTLSKRDVMYIIFPLEIFIRIVKLLIVPVLISAIISTLGNLNIKIFREIGPKMMIYFILITLIAVFLGIILAMVISPGNLDGDKIQETKMEGISTPTTKIMDFFRNLFPDNIVKACIIQTSIIFLRPENVTLEDGIKNYSSWNYGLNNYKNTNTLGLVVFSIGLGVILNIMKEEGKPILLFFMCLDEVVMIVLKWIFWLSPVGVLFAMIENLIKSKDPTEFIKQILLYILTDLLALFIHIVIILPLFYIISNKQKPFAFVRRMMKAISRAFITASGLATLSVSKFCIESDSRINPMICNVCLPIGHVMNMNGSAISLPIATIFIAQVRKLSIGTSHIIIIGLMSVVNSFFIAAIPYSSIISVAILLNSINLPVEDIAVVLVIDWFLDRYQTIVNVLGNCYACAIINKFCKAEMEKFKRKSSLIIEEPKTETKYSEVEILKIESLPRPSFEPSVINVAETEYEKEDKISDIKSEKEIEEMSLEREVSEAESVKKSLERAAADEESVEKSLEVEEIPEEEAEEEEAQIPVEHLNKDAIDISYEEYLKKLLAE